MIDRVPDSMTLATVDNAPAGLNQYGDEFDVPEGLGWTFVQYLRTAPTAGSLDVYIETTFDNGVSWVEIGHFQQQTSGSSLVRRYAKVGGVEAEAEFASSDALTATNWRDVIGAKVRVRSDVVGAGLPDYTIYMVAA